MQADVNSEGVVGVTTFPAGIEVAVWNCGLIHCSLGNTPPTMVQAKGIG